MNTIPVVTGTSLQKAPVATFQAAKSIRISFWERRVCFRFRLVKVTVMYLLNNVPGALSIVIKARSILGAIQGFDDLSKRMSKMFEES